MTTTSLHGSSSFVALKKRKGSTPSCNCKRGGGLSSLSWWVQTEADDDDEPCRLIVVRCLKAKEEETHPVSQLQARPRPQPQPHCHCEGVGYCRCRGCRR